MIGTRHPDITDPVDVTLPPGGYAKYKHIWFACSPNNIQGVIRTHSVEEHDDRSITVTPSLWFNQGGEPTWHGFLTKGIWKSA